MKKNIIILIAVILGASAIAIGGAYAFFTASQTSTKNNTATVGTLTMALSDTAFTLENMVPQSDAVGATNTPYSMTVTNNGTLAAKYNICLTLTADTSATECTVANAAALYGKIKFNVDGGTTYALLSTLTKGNCPTGQVQFPNTSTTYSLAAKTGATGPSKTHTFAMWIDSAAGNEITKCGLTVKASVSAFQSNRTTP